MDKMSDNGLKPLTREDWIAFSPFLVATLAIVGGIWYFFVHGTTPMPHCSYIF